MTATTADPADTAEQPSRSRLRRPLLPARMRPRNRPRLILELAFTVALYLAYSRTRRYVPRQRTAALHRAREVLHFEKLMHVNFELSLNHAVDRVDWLTAGMNYYYASLHFLVTPAVLIWLYACRPAYYRAARTALFTATCLALVGFTFFALAPPRFLASEGFIDTIVQHRTHGSWDSGHVSTVSNQYAAMPSVHIVWSAWCGLTLFFLARWTWLRVLGVCYPLLTFVVIISTANHFLADAVAGAATLTIGFLLQRTLFGRRAYPRLSWRGGKDDGPPADPPPSGSAADVPSGSYPAVRGALKWGKRNSVRLRKTSPGRSTVSG
jgi:hypothetical protein